MIREFSKHIVIDKQKLPKKIIFIRIIKNYLL